MMVSYYSSAEPIKLRNRNTLTNKDLVYSIKPGHCRNITTSRNITTNVQSSWLSSVRTDLCGQYNVLNVVQGSSILLFSTRHFSSRKELTHIDKSGKAVMVNVGDKVISKRTACAQASVIVGHNIMELIKQSQLKKGDALSVAELAGIMAAKQTSNLIPLCHNIALSKVDVALTLNEDENTVVVQTYVECDGRTGVEMEALTAAAVAALTVYDMCKAVSKEIIITNIQLLSKTGGAHGDFHRN